MAHVDTTAPATSTAEPADGPRGRFDALPPVAPSADGCEDCLRIASAWVHLRLVRAHAATSERPVLTSPEPGESWGRCRTDDLAVRSG